MAAGRREMRKWSLRSCVGFVVVVDLAEPGMRFEMIRSCGYAAVSVTRASRRSIALVPVPVPMRTGFPPGQPLEDS